MDYALIFVTALMAFSWGMLFAFWLIFARTASRVASLLSRITGKEVTLEEVYQTLKNIIDKAYEEMRREENENPKNNK
ncbi:MAG TPA: hypothetical protein ENJ70_00465 [Thermoplasmatales archaeon]|nr:hypothetical protein [Thermoplasmata archaeon]HHO57008.1 hypothetical protein [Thermoplasmatales archaeon]